MKKSYRWAALAAIVLPLSYLMTLAVAQQGPVRAPAGPSAAGQSIALLDVFYIFKHHNRFKSQMDEMKADVQHAENLVKTEKEKIRRDYEDLPKTYNKGTMKYKKAEEAIVDRDAKLNLNVSRQKQEFLQREAKIYHTVYQEICQVTDYYCKTKGIDMVLRFNGDPSEVERPETVQAKITQPVVWYRDQMDITPIILAELNRAPAATAPNTANRPGVALPPRR